MRTIMDLIYGQTCPEAQRLDLYLPDEQAFPVFIFFHGGGLEKGDKQSHRESFEELAQAGIAVVSANYRMYPSARYPEFIQDAAQAVAWVKKNISAYGACQGIYVGGSSAGGYLSMMLCFDSRYLKEQGIMPEEIAGYVHGAGQPTCHFNVLRERGLDTRRVIVDEAAPVYHVGLAPQYPPMEFIIADHDMEARYEQTLLMMATLRHFGYEMNNIRMNLLQGKHCQYMRDVDAQGKHVFAQIVSRFIQEHPKA